MTNNHTELLGVETTLQSMLYELNLARRDGTLLQVANILADIQKTARDYEWAVNDLLRPCK